jgi:hypothetical protein
MQSMSAGIAVSSSGVCSSAANSACTLQSSAHDRQEQHEAGATAGLRNPPSFAAAAIEPPFGQATGPLFPPLGPLLSEDLQPTTLSGQQMLPAAPATGDDDDEDNCVQS